MNKLQAAFKITNITVAKELSKWKHYAEIVGGALVLIAFMIAGAVITVNISRIFTTNGMVEIGAGVLGMSGGVVAMYFAMTYDNYKDLTTFEDCIKLETKKEEQERNE